MPEEHNPSAQNVAAELEAAFQVLREYGGAYLKMWQLARVPAALWRCDQYPDIPKVWIVGVVGQRCFYFNPVEEGWGWGRFAEWGVVAEFHHDDLEAHHFAGTLVAELRAGADIGAPRSS